MAYFDAYTESMKNLYDANAKQADIGMQKQRDALNQADWLTENQQKQAQQAFLNQDTVSQRKIAEKAQDAADLGDISAIKFLKAMNEPQDNGPSGAFTRNAAGQMVPAQLRPGEIPITQGQPQQGNIRQDLMGGIGLSPLGPQMGGGQSITADRLVASVLKQNPDLANNPQAFFATIDKLKTLFPQMDTKNLELAKFQLEQQKASPDYQAKIAQAKESGKNSGDMKQVATGAKDVLSTYQLLKDAISKPDSKLPSGAAQSGLASAANYLNIPTEGSVAQGKFDANLNNLFLATVRTLKGTGRVMKAELDNIAAAQPKASDSNAVKLAKTQAHMDYYQNRMKALGFDPETGQAIEDKGSAPEGQQPASGGAPAGNDPLGLFGP